MLAHVRSAALMGIDAVPVDVEVDVSHGLPAFAIAGLGDTSEHDARERIRAAVKNSGGHVPPRRILVNLAPADLRKEGAAFDLPIALGLLAATGQVTPAAVAEVLAVGELALDGRVRAVPGVLAVARLARVDHTHLVVPEENAAEAAAVPNVRVIPVASLTEAVGVLEGRAAARPVVRPGPPTLSPDGLDFSDVKGQEHARRALLVAAAGGHHLLMIGPPGSGKTMLARRLATILPVLSLEEALEVTQVHSVAGLIPPHGGLMEERPFRAPHHSISRNALIGGGPIPRPGEISLAHHGVLFLDELPEFQRDVLEVLREPVEEGVIRVSRVRAAVRFPARFMLVAAMNPCPCGYVGDRERVCACTPAQVARYLGRVSGPLLDRIDLHVEVPRLSAVQITAAPDGQGSVALRACVAAARQRQRRRFRRALPAANAEMSPSQLRRHCSLSPQAAALLRSALDRLALSARAHDRVLRVARTIADLEQVDVIEARHVSEAIQYRALDRAVRAMPP